MTCLFCTFFVKKGEREAELHRSQRMFFVNVDRSNSIWWAFSGEEEKNKKKKKSGQVDIIINRVVADDDKVAMMMNPSVRIISL